MINNIDDFISAYPKAAIVNYDIARVHGYGLTFRTTYTNKEKVEKFRVDNGKYLEYPYIQPYSTLDGDNYNIFFIRNNQMFELEKGKENNTFTIKRIMNDIDINMFDSIFYMSKNKHKKSANRPNEPIYRIVEK